MSGNKPYRIAVLLLAPLAFAGCRPREIPPAVGDIIQSNVESRTLPAAVRDQKERRQAWKEMQSFYAKRQFRPAWITPTGARPQARELIAAIDPLAAEGLDPRLYRKDALTSALGEIDKHPDLDDPQVQRRLATTDMDLTFTYLTMAAHLASGRLQPETLNIDWYTKPRSVDLGGRLEQAMQPGGSVRATLQTYAPVSAEYAHLRDALARYRGIAARGGWPAAGVRLQNGTPSEKDSLLRARLAAEGDLPPVSAQGTMDPLALGLARFQHRHGLNPTGKLDADTLAELDVPVAERIRQIEVNLERRRWLPSDFGQRYIAVNIPQFRLVLVEDGKPTLEMRVIVGKAQRNRTPVFSDKMTYLVLNPAWNIPDDIVVKEIKPALEKDPGYLRRKDIEVVKGWADEATAVDPSGIDFAKLGKGSEYRLRARPGPDNPLGQIKFMLPNQFDVYLHDTPAGHLFNASERDFSHGCIRLEKPLDLADALLKDDPKWAPETLREAIAEGGTRIVSLRHPLPVHILYFTAWADDAGTVEFRRDVYGEDAKLAAALAHEPPVTLGFDAVRGQVRAAL